MSVTKGKAMACIATGLALAVALTTGASARPLPLQELGSRPSVAQSTTIFFQLEPELQRFVDRQERLPGQESRVVVRISPEPATGTIWVDLDSGYLPRGQAAFSEDLGDKIGEITDELSSYLSGIVEFKYVRARIGGKTLDELFPPEYLKERKGKRSGMAPVPGLVVLNPGHGKYLHHADSTWRHQRPEPYAGTADVYEDLVTPGYSSVLAAWLGHRSSDIATDIRHTRAIYEAGIDPESNLPWSELAARYHIKRLHPDLGPAIWNLFPNGVPDRPDRKNLREYDEDLVARPKYANYLNAEVLISLHTDAGPPTARGASVMTKLGDAPSVQLANNILCYMREQIQGQEDYSDFVIRPNLGDGSRKAEVREAAMTTALIEIGFHTNMEDSVALRDSAFRSAAMRGVDKGYRTFKRGETDCRPLTITDAPPVTGPHLTEIPYVLQFSGTPAYPIYLRSKIVSCPPDYRCAQNSQQFASPGSTPGTLSGIAKCTVVRPIPGSVIVLDRYLEDSDGVRSPMVRTSITCT
ncbi:N-acetylmuramoyl-L-alanine amidase [Stenotrophomonas rhizophila]|uniref:N-acetylmuramoyl-L-alanine amidase n=1 Tax=Stenotrophomonas rhizophila TaxID=216778 RepID=UPI001E407249|nr:N-acetylmuramoyl-L-alanine amidase [Stenotrophomonas rhizophila]MCC7635015.1 N-acetylmuramoyl-L-alanine amidase [Stenotrophomonas rhizophila]MCC7662608.1 N-acetylmuramoyl-L-alanine amidase [Stenotrophomonas rhizophila]